MTKEWSLDVLYTGLDDPKFAADQERLDGLTEQLNALAESWAAQDYPDAGDMIEKALLLEEEYRSVLSNMMSYLSLSQSVDTTNAAISGAMSVLEAKASRAAKANVMINRQIAKSGDLEPFMGTHPLLKEYEYYLSRVQKSAAHMLSDDAEEMISQMNLTGGGAWAKLSDYLTATVQVPYDGRIANLSEVRNLCSDPDREVRKAAYEAELAAYPQIADAMAFALNNIKSQVKMLSKKRGYASPLAMTLEDSAMKQETLDAMFTAMKEYMPKFHEYMKAKAKKLGVGDSLAWFDMLAPVGSDDKRYTIEEAKEYLIRSFSAFSPDMAEMMERAFDESWIDFEPHAGKVGGAFCSPLVNAKQSRILTNFNGSFGAVDTLAHELGHAYHNLHTQDLRILNQHGYGMQLAETASTFNETHIMLKAISEAEGEQKLALLDSILSNTNQIICDIYSRFLFEDAVFSRCQDEFLMPEQLKEIMLNAQKEASGDGLTPEYLHPYMWVCKSHYYSEGLSYYNFPYAFGGLFAMGLYAQYQKEGQSFVPKYQNLLHETPVRTCEEVAAMADIDITKKEFWEQSMEAFAKLIDEFVELAK